MSVSATYKSPLEGFENLPPLPDTINADGKSLYNPPGTLSKAYEAFPAPIDSSSNGFDFHIYYMPSSEAQAKYARELHERIRREFPELRSFKFRERATGPHPVPDIKVEVFTPHQVGAFFSWLVVNRGPLSVLIHPNTGAHLSDHTEQSTWIGRPWPIKTEIFQRH